jgi:hypothetical protein
MAFGNKIREVNRLIQKYPLPNGQQTKAEDWKKVKGVTYATNGKTVKKIEMHWYQCDNIGKVEYKSKQDI